MPNELTERFKNCIDYLKEKQHFPSLRQFSNSINVHPQCISDIFTGKREVNTDIIQKTYACYSINPNYIFTGKGDFIISEDVNTTEDKDDAKPKSNIPCIISEFQFEYLKNRSDDDFLESMPSLSLLQDKFCTGIMRAFEVTNDLMEPSLTSGETVVAQMIDDEKWSKLINKFVYVIVTVDNLLIKRLVGIDEKKGIMKISCDNAFYEEESVDISEIKEIWQVRTKISPFRPSQDNSSILIHQEVDSLKGTITEQSKMINSLNTTIEKLLKQNRRSTAR